MLHTKAWSLTRSRGRLAALFQPQFDKSPLRGETSDFSKGTFAKFYLPDLHKDISPLLHCESHCCALLIYRSLLQKLPPYIHHAFDSLKYRLHCPFTGSCLHGVYRKTKRGKKKNKKQNYLWFFECLESFSKRRTKLITVLGDIFAAENHLT